MGRGGHGGREGIIANALTAGASRLMVAVEASKSALAKATGINPVELGGNYFGGLPEGDPHLRMEKALAEVSLGRQA